MSAIRTAVVTHYTEPPDGSTTICTDELGPVIPRTFAPAPGRSSNGHRIKALLVYNRGEEKVWIYGVLRVRDGKEITRCAASRNSKNYIELLKAIEAETQQGTSSSLRTISSFHNSLQTRTWLEEHPRIKLVFIPKGACWLNLHSRKAGGASSDAMRSLARVLLMPVKLSERCRWPPRRSTTEPNPGFGDGLPKRSTTCIVSFVTAFEEQSSKWSMRKRCPMSRHPGCAEPLR